MVVQVHKFFTSVDFHIFCFGLQVRDKFSWFYSFLDVPEARRGGVASSMFPSGRTHIDEAIEREFSNIKNSKNGFRKVENCLTADNEISDFPLERCMRIMPHDQNGGAFFIAVFRKLAASPGNFTILKKAINFRNS